jgi:hypothetical protein
LLGVTPTHDQVRIIRVDGVVVTAVNQVLQEWQSDVDGFITDVVVAGSVADIKAIKVANVIEWYCPHLANDKYGHVFKSGIPFKKGEKIQLIVLSAASGTHYGVIRGIRERRVGIASRTTQP